MIDGKLKELNECIVQLESSYKTLNKTVSDTYTRIDYLLYFFIRFQTIVKDSIHTLEKEIFEQTKTNKQNAIQLVRSTEKLIQNIHCSLGNYIKSELDTIIKALKPKKKDFEEKMKYTKSTINLYIRQIKMILSLIRKITLSLESISKITLKKYVSGISYSFEFGFEIIESFKKYEKTVITEEFQEEIENIIDIIVPVNPTESFPDLSSSTCDLFNPDKIIQDIDKYIKCLDQCTNQLKEKKVTIEAEFERVENQLKELKPLEKVKSDKREYSEESADFKTEFKYQISLLNTLTSYKYYISLKKTEILIEIYNLDERIKDFAKELESFKSKLQKLKDIKELNEQLNGYKTKDGTLKKITIYFENLNYEEHEFKILGIDGKEFKYSEYCQNLGDIIGTVGSLYDKICEAGSDESNAKVCNLLSAKCDLYQVKWRLENLQTYGKNIKDLKLITLSLEQLKSIQEYIEKIKPSNEKNNLPNSDSTFGKLLKDDEILYSMKNALGSIDNEIKGINNDKPDHSKLYDIKYNIDKLVVHSESINKYNESLNGINNLEISKSNSPGGVTRELQEFSDKLGYIAVSLNQIMQYLEDYSKKENNDEIRFIKDSIELNIRNNIPYIQRNIPKIKSEGTNIPTLYSTYKAKFSAFKEAITSLETCLDYLIKGFLRCSICTTICNIKRQIGDTPGGCPDSDCNCCQGGGVMTDKVSLLQTSMHSYSWLLLAHFSTLDTKVFISKLYRCILRADDIVDIVQVVDCCGCVKKLQGNNRAGNAERAENSNHPKTCIMTYREYVERIKSNKETQDNPLTLDTPGDIDNNLNHLCLCLAISHKLYPCLLKTVTLLVQLELAVSGNIAKKFGTHSVYNLYYKHSSYNLYDKHSGCNSYNQSVSMMLVLATWVMMQLASFLERRYKIEHDKVKCCTKDKGECKCECKTNKNGGSSIAKCFPCCGCENNGRTALSSGPIPQPKQCCCTKVEGKKGCEKLDCNKDGSKPCCCKCCCQCVCENKRTCECTCNPEGHCFCSKYGEDCYYRWFIYVILYICHLVDDAFSLGYWDIQHAIQLLSNLIPRLDAVCYEPDRKCVTIAVKPGKATQTGTAGTGRSEQTQAAPQPPSSPSPPPLPKIRCFLVCINVKVVCVSRHVLCVTHVLVKGCDKENDKKEECKLEDIKCICECDSGKSCLEQLKKLDVKDNLKCELFKGLKDKLTKLTDLNSVNGDTPTPKWTVNCECKPERAKCPCKEVTMKNGEVCKNLIEQLSKVKDIDELKCGCESVKPCCCCCKCDECGTGKKRKCNEKGCGHGHGHNGQAGGDTQASGAQAAPAGAANNVDNKCPCQEGNNGKECCCKDPGPGGKRRCCNCTKAEAKPPAAKDCECCCMSCCALEKEDNQQQPQAQPQEQSQEVADTNTNKCPCKKKKKKEKKKGPHCKDDDNLKDKRCCCKCCPKKKGEGAAPANGKPAGDASTTTGSTNGNNGVANGASSNNTTPNPKDDKECCCCCQCKTNCKNGAAAVGGGGNSNGCSCHNSSKHTKNGNNGHKDCDCNCYCCSECEHKKSALKSVCKQLAYDLNSGILVLSKMASNLTIECVESDKDKCLVYPEVPGVSVTHL